MSKIVELQALRFVAAIGVVAIHAMPGFTIGRYGVDLFFVISGFVMVYASTPLFGQPGAWRTFISRRIIRIVPLYWLATLITAYLCGPFSFQRVATSLLFIPYWEAGKGMPLLSVGWTLNVEMFFYAVFACCIWLPRRYAVLTVCVILTILVLLGYQLPPSIYAVYWMNPKMLEFAGGCMLGLMYCKDWLPSPKVKPTSLIGRVACTLGDSSYALYLTHPLMMLLTLNILLIVCAAIVVYFVVERPITRTAKRISTMAFTRRLPVPPRDDLQQLRGHMAVLE